MLKRLATLIGVTVFAFAVLNGCADSPSAPDSDPLDKAAIGSVDVTPESQELFRDPPGDPGNRNVGNARLSLERLVRLLGLNERQTSAMEDCLEAHRECVQRVNTIYRERRHELMELYRERLAEIREAVEAGTMTREEARAAIASASQRIRGALRDAKEAHANGLTRCKAALDTCVDRFLTDEQMARWTRLTSVPPRRR